MGRRHAGDGLVTTTLVIPTEAPKVSGPPQGRWTYADWESLPDDGNRYEIIDGAVYMTTAPSSFHQWITGRLWRYIGVPAEDLNLCYAFNAPIGVIMPGCDPVQPDFVIVLRERSGIIHDRRIWGVPDLLVEILSLGNAVYDLEVKLAAYARAGVPEYAVVDPSARTVSCYRSDDSGTYPLPRVYTETDSLNFLCLPAVSIVVGALLAGAPDTTP